MNSSMRAMVFGVVVLGGSLIACKGLSKKMEEEAKKAAAKAAASAVSGDAALTPEDQADIATSGKLSKYITCLNLVTRQVSQSRRRYASWADWEKGPTGKERYVWGLFEVHNVDQCKKALAEAKPMQPALADIDKLAGDYEKALDALVPVVKKAYDYYEGKKYKDDSFAEAKAMHSSIKEAFEGFSKANEAFDKAVGDKNDALLHKAVDRLERTQGKKFAWHKQSTMLNAQELVKVIDKSLEASKAAKNGEMPEADIVALGTAIDKFEAKTKEMVDYAASAKDKPILYSFFETDLKKYTNAARAFWRHRRDKKKFSSFEISQIRGGSGWMVEGSYDQVLKAYNDLIDRSNAMNR